MKFSVIMAGNISLPSFSTLLRFNGINEIYLFLYFNAKNLDFTQNLNIRREIMEMMAARIKEFLARLLPFLTAALFAS